MITVRLSYSKKESPGERVVSLSNLLAELQWASSQISDQRQQSEEGFIEGVDSLMRELKDKATTLSVSTSDATPRLEVDRPIDNGSVSGVNVD